MAIVLIAILVAMLLCAAAYGAGYDKGRHDGVIVTKYIAVTHEKIIERWKHELKEK